MAATGAGGRLGDDCDSFFHIIGMASMVLAHLDGTMPSSTRLSHPKNAERRAHTRHKNTEHREGHQGSQPNPKPFLLQQARHARTLIHPILESINSTILLFVFSKERSPP